MADAKKRDDQPQAKLFPFILVWALGCFLASWLYILLLDELDYLAGLEGLGYLLILNLGLFIAISTVQFYVIRRYLYVELRGWVPLSLAGVIAGIVAMHLLSGIGLYLEQPVFALAFALAWGMPAVFQWFILRKRFVNHGLWLLAAAIMGPVYAFVFAHDDGILATLAQNLFPGANGVLLETAALAGDFVLPPIILGLILFVVVKLGGKSEAVEEDVY